MLTQKTFSSLFLALPSRRQASQKAFQKGFTLIETLLVFMVLALAVAGIVVLAQVVVNNFKVTRSKQVILMIGSGIQQTYGQSGANSYGSGATGLPFSTDNLYKNSTFVPSDLVQSDKVYLPVGTGATAQVLVAGAGSTFLLGIANAQDYCPQLASVNFGVGNIKGADAVTGGSSGTLPAAPLATANINTEGSAMTSGAIATTACAAAGDGPAWEHI